MTLNLFILYAVFGAAGLITLNTQRRSGHAVKGFILTLMQGAAALLAVKAIGGLIGIYININIFSLAVSGIFGTAGVILLLLINAIL